MKAHLMNALIARRGRGIVAAVAGAVALSIGGPADACLTAPASAPAAVVTFTSPTTATISFPGYTTQAVGPGFFCAVALRGDMASVVVIDAAEVLDATSTPIAGFAFAPNAQTTADFSGLAGVPMDGWCSPISQAVAGGQSASIRFTVTFNGVQNDLLTDLGAADPLVGSDGADNNCGLNLTKFALFAASSVIVQEEPICFEPQQNCQLPDQAGHGAAGTVGATSDANPGFAVADNFTPTADGTVSTVCWWGFYIDFGGPTDCGPGGGDIFRIRYYADAGGIPGALLAVYGGLVVDKIETGATIATGIGPVVEYQFATTHPPLAVSAGTCYWIEIQNSSIGTCFWLWETAPPGDLLSYQKATPTYSAGDASDYDLAFCVDAELGDTLACQPSACCLSDGTCQEFFEQGECDALAGQFHLGTGCSEGGIICPVDNSCSFDNGEGSATAGANSSQYAPGEFWSEGADNFTLKGSGTNDCLISQITWWTSHFNQQAACDPPTAVCTFTPADYAKIWVVIYNDEDGAAKGPTGHPEHAGDPPVPTGQHDGLVKNIIQVLPAQFTWIPYEKDGMPVPDSYEITITLDPPLALEKNKKNWIAISAQVPFTNFYQVGWMESQNYDGNPAQQNFEVLTGSPDWTIIGLDDLAFRLVGEKEGALPCPADFDGNHGVGFSDLLIFLANWGPCDPPGPCPQDGDFDLSGDVGFSDLLIFLGFWGCCDGYMSDGMGGCVPIP